MTCLADLDLNQEPHDIFVGAINRLQPTLNATYKGRNRRDYARVEAGAKADSHVDLVTVLTPTALHVEWIHVRRRARQGTGTALIRDLAYAARVAGYLDLKFDVGASDSAMAFWAKFLGRKVRMGEEVVIPLTHVSP